MVRLVKVPALVLSKNTIKTDAATQQEGDEGDRPL